jgi:hypothetical protein
MAVTSLINPHLRAVARWRVSNGVLDDTEFEKTAQPPGMDPMAGGGGGAPGGAPPMPDPAAMAAGGGGGAAPMGGAPAPPPGPLDPATLAQITQAIGGAGGGMNGPGGKGGGKKAEQQLLDTKLWTIQFLLVKICESMNIQVPPSIVVGPPPDQTMMQQAQQEQAAPGGGGATMQGPNDMGGGGAVGAGGAPPPPGPGPIPPMDASQGPIGGTPGGGGGEKMGSAIRSLSSLMDEDTRRPFDVGSEYSLESLREVRSKAAAMAALSRSLKNGTA